MSNNVAIAKVKKNDTVIMCAFTGMKLGVFEVVAVDKGTVTVATKKGEIVFDRKTGKQIEPEPKAERFASSIIPDDGSYVPPQRKPKAKSTKKATKAKTEPEEKDEEDEEPEEKPKKKVTKKSAPKKSTKKKPDPDEDEDEDEDDDDDWDDDDFEEVE